MDQTYGINDYLVNCFLYNHNNPLVAKIVDDLKDWPYSSWPDYYLKRADSICNLDKAKNKIDFTEIDFRTHNQNPDDNIIDLLF
jgi:hypothetical protein